MIQHQSVQQILEDTYLDLSAHELPSRIHYISAEDYLALTQNQKQLIKSTQFVLPKVRFGQNRVESFGKFKVSLKHAMTKKQFLSYK